MKSDIINPIHICESGVFIVDFGGKQTKVTNDEIRILFGMVGWQPIETAPKDGRWIIVYGESNSICNTAFASYRPGDRQFNNGSSWHVYGPFGNWMVAGHKFTHWMPLPEPPK